MIVQAPSEQEHSFVVRNDSGGTPYYVFQQSNGKVVCDQCERYKSAKKICCHSLAVAEKCGALDKFLTWYRRSPRTITATGFVTSDSSKTFGRKGNQERPSTVRRKEIRSKPSPTETVTTVQRADMAFLQANQSTEQQSAHGKTGAACSNGITPLSTRPTITPHPPAATVTHLHGPHYEPTPSLPSPYRKTAYPSPSYGSFVVYPLALCPPQVSTCYGCSAPLKPGGKIAPLPGDLVFVSNMMRSFTQNIMEYQKQSSVYFHCNVKCVQARQPYFLGVFC